ncbi:MAG: glycosyltransferase family 4 protein [Herpetosiphonaceae bacterium]|nr:glycosyltransferase family 4 protein [Herpetosiphonaceae bacterium]
MRIAFVVVRYGLDVHGGAEYHCREWAERLATRHHVEVLTTCARDFVTWADYYAPGVELINGVRVQRFRVDAPRDNDTFNAFSHIIFGGPHSDEQEIEWMRRQGPYATGLFSAIAAQHDDFDLFIFMTYLYCTTYFGLPLARDKAVLVPTAHDELPIYLRLFQRLFALPRYLIYNTPTERTMLHELFDIASLPGSEVGVGIDVPSFRSMVAEASPPLLLYIGRVDTSKGCEQLYDYFLRYKQAHPSPLQLAFAGRANITLPPHPDVQMLGFVSEERKRELLAQCALVVLPSPFESLSILCLEAWAAAKPTLVNGTTPVLRDQTVRSNGGLFYQDYAEFAACLDLLLADHQLRQQLGRQGRRFVEQWYSWLVVEERLEAALHTAVEVTR